MKVKELIGHLKKLPQDAIVIRHDGQGFLPLQEYQLNPQQVIEKRKMVRCYMRQSEDGESCFLLP